MLPCRRELDPRKRDDSAAELDLITFKAPKRRPTAPEDAPREAPELPESSPSAPQRVPGSSLEHSWRSQIAPTSPTGLNMTLQGLKSLPQKGLWAVLWCLSENCLSTATTTTTMNDDDE